MRTWVLGIVHNRAMDALRRATGRLDDAALLRGQRAQGGAHPACLVAPRDLHVGPLPRLAEVVYERHATAAFSLAHRM